MTFDQIAILSILALALALFLWGRFRHDIVALSALLAAVALGLVPGDEAFAGFGHSAVITVAAVLILSRALQTTGAVDRLIRALLPKEAGRIGSLAALLGLGAGLSAFMNNVGAMALLMPAAAQMAKRAELPPGRVLMPLAFCTILGGMTTLIGTPPNLIVSGFRAGAGSGPFGMFDFSLVGVPVALAGVAFIALVGWRLVPSRKPGGAEDFEPGAYLTELRVGAESKAAGLTIRGAEAALEETGGQIVALVRDGVRIDAPHGGRRLTADDIVVVEAETEALKEAIGALGLELAEGDVPEAGEATEIRELVVRPGSSLVDRSARAMRLRTRYGLNLLAVAREGRRTRARLRTLAFRPGDLLLIQGPPEAVADFANETGAAPLAARDLETPDRRRGLLAAGALVASILLVVAGALPAAAAFTLGVVALAATGVVPLRTLYDAVDWPVIVLLGALIPIAAAMEATGAVTLIAEGLIGSVAGGAPVLALVIVLVATMCLSDVINNAATAAVMCPIALGAAAASGADPDAFLMAVAIGASCAFLTPIGHQNNTLILGPGGFRFADYWRLGLPLEALVVAVALPLLVVFWGV